MFILLRAMACLGLVIVASACAAPRIDTSSDETMKRSIEKARTSLPEDRRAKFDEALQVVAISGVDLEGTLAAAFPGKTTNPGDVTKDMKAALHGKTAEEVIEAANRVTEARKAKESERAIAEIAELIKERDAAQAARGELAKFEILRSRFSLEKGYFGMSEPKIMLRVRNGTAHPVSRAYFLGILTSPGRSVPWLKEEFNYQISGGLEPGEEATWELTPNSFTAWGTVKAPRDVGLHVIVTRLDGPDGNPLFSVRDFTEEDQARLATLQREYAGAPK